MTNPVAFSGGQFAINKSSFSDNWVRHATIISYRPESVKSRGLGQAAGPVYWARHRLDDHAPSHRRSRPSILGKAHARPP